MLKRAACIFVVTAWAWNPCVAAGPAFPLRSSPDGCYLVDSRGVPFFYHADTACQLPKKATRAVAEE